MILNTPKLAKGEMVRMRREADALEAAADACRTLEGKELQDRLEELGKDAPAVRKAAERRAAYAMVTRALNELEFGSEEQLRVIGTLAKAHPGKFDDVFEYVRKGYVVTRETEGIKQMTAVSKRRPTTLAAARRDADEILAIGKSVPSLAADAQECADKVLELAEVKCFDMRKAGYCPPDFDPEPAEDGTPAPVTYRPYAPAVPQNPNIRVTHYRDGKPIN